MAEKKAVKKVVKKAVKKVDKKVDTGYNVVNNAGNDKRTIYRIGKHYKVGCREGTYETCRQAIIDDYDSIDPRFDYLAKLDELKNTSIDVTDFLFFSSGIKEFIINNSTLFDSIIVKSGECSEQLIVARRTRKYNTILVKSQHPSVRQIVAQDPKFQNQLLYDSNCHQIIAMSSTKFHEELIQTGGWKVRCIIANMSDEFHDSLFEDGDEDVRASVALRSNKYDDYFEHEGNCSQVREAIQKRKDRDV